MPNTPTVTYADGLTVGQLAQRWGRDMMFVRRMISEDKLVQDDGGVITHAALHDFHVRHGTELD